MNKGQERDMEQYLTTKQLMDLLQISRSSIHRWIEQGMPCVKAGSLNRFPKEEVLAWLEGGDESEQAKAILQEAQEILEKVRNMQKQGETVGRGK
jgi:excisionase family DNA binding protein